MDVRDVEKLLQRYADTLPDAEALARVRPELSGKTGVRRGIASPDGRRRILRLGLLGGATMSLAAVLLFLLLPRADLTLSVSVAASPSDLFVRRGESGPLRDQFWIGVQVGSPCWIHLIQRTENGYLVIARPERSTDRYAYRVGGRAELGPFKVVETNTPAGPSALTHLMVVAAKHEISSEVIAGAMPDFIAVGGNREQVFHELDRLANTLRRRFDCAVDVQALPDPRE